MSELGGNIIDKIKKWNIKRKSEYILCPYCLHDYHEVVKRIKERGMIFSRPIYKCCQCNAIFKHNGKKFEVNEIDKKKLKIIDISTGKDVSEHIEISFTAGEDDGLKPFTKNSDIAP